MSRHRSADEHDPHNLSSHDFPEISSEVPRTPLRAADTRSVGAIGHAPNSIDHDERNQPNSERFYYMRDRVYVLRESQFATLLEVGKFRVVSAADLARFAYGGDSKSLARDIRPLERQGLLLRRPLPNESTTSRSVLTLTKKGKRLLLASGRIPDGQAIYHGIVKPREQKHDAALYRLYQKEMNRIARAGGKTVRVVLDYELKRRVNREIALQAGTADDRIQRQAIAERHGLAFIGGKIQMPDVRIEYETVEHQRAQIDLELATRNYRPRALAEKAKAGFSLYAAREDASKLRRILDESELTARIFAL
jgi:DNA-binding MarR family transcriptional regulator